MKWGGLNFLIGAAGVLVSCCVSEAAAAADDRVAFSADGTTLTGTNGGGGAALNWLHDFSPDSLVSLGVEHDVLANAHWTFGSVTGAISRGSGDQRYSLYGEVHEGSGRDASGTFSYSNVVAGVSGTYYHRFTTQLEDRQIDIVTAHGNLPKLALAYLWSPHLLTTLSYAHSVSGNLGTHLVLARIDGYGKYGSLFVGGASGQAVPAVFNFQTNTLTTPPRTLHEGYVGFTHPFASRRSELSLIVDYIQLVSVNERWTLTLNYIFHVGHAP